MAQFDVYRNPNAETAAHVPFLVDIQTGFLDGLSTRVVVPLRHRDRMIPGSRLNPVFDLDGAAVVLATAELAAVSLRSLGDPIASLARHRDEIVAAVDFLTTGI